MVPILMTEIPSQEELRQMASQWLPAHKEFVSLLMQEGMGSPYFND